MGGGARPADPVCAVDRSLGCVGKVDIARPGVLCTDPSWTEGTTLPNLQASHDVPQCRSTQWTGLGCEAGLAHYSARKVSARYPSRRASTTLECAARRDVAHWPTPGAT